MSTFRIDDIDCPIPNNISFPTSNNVDVQPIPFSNSPDVTSTSVSERSVELEMKFTGSDAYDKVERLRGRIENQAFNIFKAHGFNLYGNHDTIMVAINSFQADYEGGRQNWVPVSLEGSLVGLPETHQYGHYFAWQQLENTGSNLGEQKRFEPEYGTFNFTESGDGTYFPDTNATEEVGLQLFNLAKVQNDITSYDASSVARQGIFFDAEPDYLHQPTWKLYDGNKNKITTTRVFHEGTVYLVFGKMEHKNLVPNATLTIKSDSSVDKIDGWQTITGTNSSLDNFKIDSKQLVSDLPKSNESLLIEASNTGASGEFSGLRTVIPVKHDQDYTFSVEYETNFSGNSSAKIRAIEYNSSATQQANHSSTNTGNGQINVSFTTSSSTSYVVLRLGVEVAAGASNEKSWFYGAQFEKGTTRTSFEDESWPFHYGLRFDLDNDKIHWLIHKEGFEKYDSGDYNTGRCWKFDIGTLSPLRCRVNHLDEIEFETGGGAIINVKQHPWIRFYLDDQISTIDFDMSSDDLQNDGTYTSPNQTLQIQSGTGGHIGTAWFQSNWNLSWDDTNEKLTNNDGTKTNWWISMVPSTNNEASDIDHYAIPSYNTYFDMV